MAIFLDNQTGMEIKRLLKKEIERPPTNFIAPRLLKMVEADDERKAKIASCEHDYQPLYGFHERCKGCGGLKNGYESWTSKELREAEKPPAVS